MSFKYQPLIGSGLVKSDGGSGNVLQSDIVRFNTDTVANAKTLDFVEGERVHIEELDEVFQAVTSTTTETNATTSVFKASNGDLYMIQPGLNESKNGRIIRLVGGIGGTEEVFYQFDQTTPYNPVGNIIEDSGVIFVECMSGGANNIGGLVTIDISSKVITTLVDYQTANTGFIEDGDQFYMDSTDKIIFNDVLYWATNRGGANNDGVINAYDLNTTTLTKVGDINTLFSTHLPPINGFATIYNNFYYLFVGGDVYKVNTTTNSVAATFSNTPHGTTDIYLVGGHRVGNDMYLTMTGDTFAYVAKFDLTTETFTNSPLHIGFASIAGGSYFNSSVFVIDATSNIVVMWDEVANSMNVITSPLEPIAAPQQFIWTTYQDGTDVYYFFADGSFVWNKVYKLDLTGGTNTLVYDAETVVLPTFDDVHYIDVGQSPLYLQVRDNHIKSVSSANGEVTFESTRGENTTIPLNVTPVQLLKNNSYPSGTNYYTITTQGSQSLDITNNCIATATLNGANFYDEVNDILTPTEGKYYQIRMLIRLVPTSDQNKITFALENQHNNDRFSKASNSTVKIGTNMLEIAFTPFIANANQAASGIKVRLDDFQGGTNARLFNLRIEITER